MWMSRGFHYNTISIWRIGELRGKNGVTFQTDIADLVDHHWREKINS